MWDPVVTQQQQIHQGHIRAGVPGPGAGGGGRTSSKRQATERAPRVCSFIITLSCLDVHPVCYLFGNEIMYVL
jgi:hypothetical protein